MFCPTYTILHYQSSIYPKSWNLVFCFFSSQYQADEQVTLWVNKVGPYNNPQETYNYYSLPFCRKTENSIHKWGGLGEVLGGNELIDSQIDIKFLSMLVLMLVFLSNFVILFTQHLHSPLLFYFQKMLTEAWSVSWNSMKLRSSISKMPSKIVTGLSYLWVCITFTYTYNWWRSIKDKKLMILLTVKGFYCQFIWNWKSLCTSTEFNLLRYEHCLKMS